MAKHFGTYKALVKHVNADGIRVRLAIPDVLGQALSAWALPTTDGTEAPATGTKVYASFANGEVNRPVYFVGGGGSGGLFGNLDGGMADTNFGGITADADGGDV